MNKQKLEKLNTTAWYICGKCKKDLHGGNFYKLPNGSRTNECCKCYDEQISKNEIIITKCKHCQFIEDTFSGISDLSNREYWIMTEIFVYLHGKDSCDISSNNYKQKELQNEQTNN